MRGVVIYVRYVVLPATILIAILWLVHAIKKIERKISSKKDIGKRRKL